MSQVHNQPAVRLNGWASFAGYLMIIAGAFQAIAGLVAIFQPTFYVATANRLWLLTYNQWGWTHLLIGIVLAFGAAALFAGKMWGRVLAITLATISALASFGFITAYPLWSLLIIAMDIMIIYGVASMGRDDYDEI
jgi:hypothetical protein